ncbi:MAG: ribosome biogenesis GTPase YlqF, partial [OM182 bacterium]|nr:ribosome biogenesis GTPase YlqF [OM182 bacterium]
VLDARSPQASSNPHFAALCADHPRIRILNKADLAEPFVTEQWAKFFNAQPKSVCLVNGHESLLDAEQIIQAARKLFLANDIKIGERQQLLIGGIPNVGKSTLLNIFCARKLAKTGNEPAVTQIQQRVRLDDHWHLIDTPGLMWPKLEDQVGAYRLAATGTIRSTAVEAEDIAWFLAQELLLHYRDRLVARFELPQDANDAESVMEAVAKARACIKAGHRIDWHKASEALLNEFRSGKLGRFSLERPPT